MQTPPLNICKGWESRGSAKKSACTFKTGPADDKIRGRGTCGKKVAGKLSTKSEGAPDCPQVGERNRRYDARGNRISRVGGSKSPAVTRDILRFRGRPAGPPRVWGP
jgi:hypothetical protein